MSEGIGARIPVMCGVRTPRLDRRGLRWALEGIVVQHLTVARIAEELDVSWNTAKDAVLAERKRVLIKNPRRVGLSDNRCVGFGGTH